MKLSIKINLFSLVIPSLMALIIVISGLSVMNRVIYDLNNKLISKDLENLENIINNEHQILKRAGVAEYNHYVDQAKTVLLDLLNNEQIDHEGSLIIIDSTRNAVIYNSENNANEIPTFNRSLFNHISGEMIIDDGLGSYYVNYIKIPHWNWIVAIFSSSDDLFREIYSYLQLVIPLSLLPLFAGLIISFFSFRNVYKRIKESLACLNEVEQGNLNIQILRKKNKDEIDDIQKAINTMISSLRDFYNQLESKVEERTIELAKTNTQLVLEISAGRKAREEISHLNNSLKNIIDSMPSILIGLNRNSTISKWNNEAAKISGLSEKEIIGKPFEDFFEMKNSSIAEISQKIAMGKAFDNYHMKLTLGNSKEFQGELTFFPLDKSLEEMGIIMIRDITERLQLEELIKQSEKMLTVGGLAAGMAHEINNPLAGMMQSAQNIQRRLNKEVQANVKAAEELGISMDLINLYSDSRNIHTMVNSILESGMQAAKIVDDMVNFSHKDQITKSLHDLVSIIHITISSLKQEPEYGSLFKDGKLKILENYPESIPQLPCDNVKMEQALYNIMSNAIQAMIQSKTENPTLNLSMTHSEDQIRLKIKDNGPGIDDSIKKRIFEPFFSTKEIDRGKGLGLSISYYIIREHHGGNLWLEDSESQGTSFVISLPLNTKAGSKS